jgi:hypothetical protein
VSYLFFSFFLFLLLGIWDLRSEVSDALFCYRLRTSLPKEQYRNGWLAGWLASQPVSLDAGFLRAWGTVFALRAYPLIVFPFLIIFFPLLVYNRPDTANSGVDAFRCGDLT